jgi:hypothetical protein
MITMIDISENSGSCCRVRNSAPGWLFAAVSARLFTAPVSCRLMAVPPRTENHTKLTTLGPGSRETNSRMVRPREIGR